MTTHYRIVVNYEQSEFVVQFCPNGDFRYPQEIAFTSSGATIHRSYDAALTFLQELTVGDLETQLRRDLSVAAQQLSSHLGCAKSAAFELIAAISHQEAAAARAPTLWLAGRQCSSILIPNLRAQRAREQHEESVA